MKSCSIEIDKSLSGLRDDFNEKLGSQLRLNLFADLCFGLERELYMKLKDELDRELIVEI